MKVLIVGTGAVGGWFGGKLAANGHDVTFVARGENGKRIREHGLVLEAPEGEFVVKARVLESVDEARGLDVDLALVAVKASALSEVAEPTGRALAPKGVAIPLLNGIESEEELAAAIGAEHVVGGVAQIASELVAPGRVLMKAGGMLTIAPFANGAFEPVRDLAKVLDGSFPCVAEDDLKRVLWQKLLWNAPFNAVCALTGRNAGDVLAEPELERLVKDAMREVCRVAAADGVDLGESAPDAMLAITRGLFSQTEPSMLQDVRAGRPTEADALQGAVVRAGQRLGRETPIFSTLFALLRGIRRRSDDFR
jgi:2-dehydropantoate 2-reductase